MSNGVKISNLTSAAALDGTEQIPVVQSGTTVKATAEQLKTLAQTNVPAANITGTLPVANGGTGVTTSTGTGSVVLSTSPTLVTPALGTPSSGVLTNATGLPIATGVSGLGTGVATFLATPSSANLAAAVTNETGSGALVFASSPTLVAPVLGTVAAGSILTNATGLPISTGVSGLGTGIAAALAVNTGSAGAPVLLNGVLGTPSSGTLTNATGLPISTGVSGLGTGIATALGVNVGSAGAPVVNGGALGTPSSGTLTSATGLPVSTGISGLGTGVATFLATPSSANLAAAVTNETGSGALVFATSPTLVTPDLGTPSAALLTNATGLPLTTGVTGTLPIASGGTGQTTANTAFNALAPSQTSQSSKFLTTDGTNTSWASPVAAAASVTIGTTTVISGTSGYILYNNAGSLGNLATTGTGSVVLSASPTLTGTVTGAFQTPEDTSQYALQAGRYSVGFVRAAMNTRGAYGWEFQVNGANSLRIDSGGITSAGTITATTSISAGTTVNAAAGSGFQLGGVTTLLEGGGYRVFYDNNGVAVLALGNTANANNYYPNTTHTFQSRGGASTFATLNSTGLALNGYQTITYSGAGGGSLYQVDTNTGGKTWQIGPGAGTGSATLWGIYNNTNANQVLNISSAGALTMTTSVTAGTFVNAAAASGYQLGGVTALIGSGAYNNVLTQTGTVGLQLKATDAYIQGDIVGIRNSTASTSFATFSSTGLALNGATSGAIKLTPTAVAGTNTLTLPAETGTLRSTVSTGTVLQVVNYTTGTFATGAGSIPIDNTIPQNTEGDEYLSLSITPKSATSKLVISVVLQLSVSAAQWTSVALFQDSTANALASGWNYIDLATAGSGVVICHYMTSGTTSATTFKVRAAGNSGITIGINGQAGIAARFGGTLSSSITITEVVP